MTERSIWLNDHGLWLLYRAMVCDIIEKNECINEIDCDPWEFSGALDMSFEETKLYPLEAWSGKILDDLNEYLTMK